MWAWAQTKQQLPLVLPAWKHRVANMRPENCPAIIACVAGVARKPELLPQIPGTHQKAGLPVGPRGSISNVSPPHGSPIITFSSHAIQVPAYSGRSCRNAAAAVVALLNPDGLGKQSLRRPCLNSIRPPSQLPDRFSGSSVLVD